MFKRHRSKGCSERVIEFYRKLLMLNYKTLIFMFRTVVGLYNALYKRTPIEMEYSVTAGFTMYLYDACHVASIY